ncbi:MAG: hypothetical protein M3H12_15275 [Chromatiales bacterium]|nr:hypothetical protein [Gammaproteobacteria bacterium]
MQRKPAGLKLRNGIWHVDKIVSVGSARKSIRRSTKCSENDLATAIHILEVWIAQTKEELLQGVKRPEHYFQEAAVQYILAIERKGKSAERTIGDLDLLDPLHW